VNVLDWSLYSHLYTVFVMHYFHILHPISSIQSGLGRTSQLCSICV